MIGTITGGKLLHGIHGSELEIIIAFAVAALLYLVIEELIVEAHKGEDSFSTTMLFVGFLIVLILDTAI